MAFEDLKVGIRLLMEEIEKNPEDALELHEQLREKIAEFEALGLPVPEDILRFERELERPEAEEIYEELKEEDE